MSGLSVGEKARVRTSKGPRSGDNTHLWLAWPTSTDRFRTFVNTSISTAEQASPPEDTNTVWVNQAKQLLSVQPFDVNQALAWQRDAAKAGAALSKEPLAAYRQALVNRTKAIEDLQHRIQVEREAAVLITQRIEVLSTKPWQDALHAMQALGADVAHWQDQSQELSRQEAWSGLLPKYVDMLSAAQNQLNLVWEAFGAALAQTQAASTDPEAALPAVPVWADQIKSLRQGAQVGTDISPAQTSISSPAVAGKSAAVPTHQSLLDQASALVSAPEGKRVGGRKLQEQLRGLREQWKRADSAHGALPGATLFKAFDTACVELHQRVDVWLKGVKEQSEQTKAQRQGLMDEVRAWMAAHAESEDWKAQARELHTFAERWRNAGHMGEKAFAAIQPQWKTLMHEAHARLQAAQDQALARRQAMIEEAKGLAAEPVLRVAAVKALQQRWQADAQTISLDRKHEQKLWDAFRQPLDEAFSRKTTSRAPAAEALSEHDRRVIEAAQAVQAACEAGEASAIAKAVSALNAISQGQAVAETPAAPVLTNTSPAESVEPASAEAAPLVTADATESTPATADGEPTPDSPAIEAPAEAAPVAKPVAPPKKLVAVRGDDRPGQAKGTATAAVERARAPRRDDKFAAGGRDARRDEGRFPAREERAPRGPRLGDTAFRAQRQALELAEQQMRRLATMAHGEVLTQLLSAWEQRQSDAMPTAQTLGSRVNAATRTAWAQALQSAPAAADASALLRLEMAAEVPTPAEQLDARRQLQLQLLTRRNDAPPAQTWAQDVARVLAQPHDATQARRLQTVLKVLLKR
jgi:ATP-dependent RNA helicase SUPV3L1/SUV3